MVTEFEYGLRRTKTDYSRVSASIFPAIAIKISNCAFTSNLFKHQEMELVTEIEYGLHSTKRDYSRVNSTGYADYSRVTSTE